MIDIFQTIGRWIFAAVSVPVLLLFGGDNPLENNPPSPGNTATQISVSTNQTGTPPTIEDAAATTIVQNTYTNPTTIIREYQMLGGGFSEISADRFQKQVDQILDDLQETSGAVSDNTEEQFEEITDLFETEFLEVASDAQIEGDLSVSGNGTLEGALAAYGIISAPSINASSTSGTSTFSGALVAERAPTLPHLFGSWSPSISGANAFNAALIVNPASSIADGNLIAAAVNGAAKFLVDAEGDVFANSLTTTGAVTLATTTASSFTVEGGTTLGDASSDLVTVNAALYALASTTLQNFTFRNATGTQLSLTSLSATGSSTIGGGTSATGLTVNGTATTTGIMLHTMSTTNARIRQGWSVDTLSISTNLTDPVGGVQDNASKSSWDLRMGSGYADDFAISRSPAGSANPSALLTLSSTGALATAADIAAGAGATIGMNGRFLMRSASNGIVKLSNAGETDFTRLQFGGTTSSFPALARSGTALAVVAADGTLNASLGIGTTTPAGKLAIHLNNGETYAGNLAFNIASSTATATSTLFVITNAGNVGIGTAQPSSGSTVEISATAAKLKLTSAVNNTVGIELLASGAAAWNIKTNSGSLDILGGGSGTTNVLNLSTSGYTFYSKIFTMGQVTDSSPTIFDFPMNAVAGGDAFQWKTLNTGGSSVVRFGVTGRAVTANTYFTNTNVGIGTTTPFAKFAINGNSGDTNTTLFAVASSTATATTTLFSVSNTGLVGINATPVAQLDVLSSAAGTIGLRVKAASGSTANVFEVLDGADANLFSVSRSNGVAVASNIDFGSGSSDGLKITASSAANGKTIQSFGADPLLLNSIGNNVGVGGASAGSQLSITGNASIGATYAALAAPTSGLLVEGNVGIGSSTPSAKLSIKGIGTGTAANFQTTNSSDVPVFTVLDNGNTSLTGSLAIGGTVTSASSITVTSSANIFLNNQTYIGSNTSSNALRVNINGVALAAAFPLSWSSSANTESSADISLSRLSAGKLGVGNGTAGDTSGTLIASTIGIGTSTPNNTLSLYSTTRAAISFSSNSGLSQWTMGQDFTDGGKFKISSSTALGTSDRLVIDGNGNTTITGSGTTCVIGSGTGATNCTSDERLKTNITEISGEEALEKLSMIRGVTFNWADPSKDQERRLGVIAQDVSLAFPEVTGEVETLFNGVKGTYLTVDYAALISPIISAINALSAKVNALANVVSGFADSFTTNRLCVGTTCITESELQEILEERNIETPEPPIDTPEVPDEPVPPSDDDGETTPDTDTDDTPPPADTPDEPDSTPDEAPSDADSTPSGDLGVGI